MPATATTTTVTPMAMNAGLTSSAYPRGLLHPELGRERDALGLEVRHERLWVERDLGRVHAGRDATLSHPARRAGNAASFGSPAGTGSRFRTAVSTSRGATSPDSVHTGSLLASPTPTRSAKPSCTALGSARRHRTSRTPGIVLGSVGGSECKGL